MQHFNTTVETYSVIFTSSATASLKLVAESFNYKADDGTKKGCFVYLEDNHTSVLGMREYAENTYSLGIEEASSAFLKEPKCNATKCNGKSLFAYPAQSNFSGTKYPFSWIEKVQQGVLNNISNLNSSEWFCILDAASYAATSFLDLGKYQPDFVCISFYKIFGYPTGLGALLVKNSSAHRLNRKYFGGGTVLLALSNENVVVRRKILHER